MTAINIIDNVERSTAYGTLICQNTAISAETIQEKINEIKTKLDSKGIEWEVKEIISQMPQEWKISYQEQNISVII